mmetsp:Transcript_13413/g.40558  ORF Transcript_13413/g.40558 Transcript_13413/m.40558 type:complete len:204 (-) Transcript_13413:761-1372(-)
MRRRNRYCLGRSSDAAAILCHLAAAACWSTLEAGRWKGAASHHDGTGGGSFRASGAPGYGCLGRKQQGLAAPGGAAGGSCLSGRATATGHACCWHALHAGAVAEGNSPAGTACTAIHPVPASRLCHRQPQPRSVSGGGDSCPLAGSGGCPHSAAVDHGAPSPSCLPGTPVRASRRAALRERQETCGQEARSLLRTSGFCAEVN